MELWTVMPSSPQLVVQRAKEYQEAGLAGMVVWDAQSSDGDCYVSLAAAAMATTSLKLGTGVTNPVTRHPAVTASAIASLQAISNGRAVLGIGRGDASLAHIGRAPASVETLSRYVQLVQRYLRGEHIPFSELDEFATNAPHLTELDVEHAPSASSLEWLGTIPKVPVEVSATGPKMIAQAALYADSVMLSVGAETERLRWGIDLVRSTRTQAGLDPKGISIGAWVNVVAHPDVEIARQLASGWTSVFARFAIMHGKPTGPQTDDSIKSLEHLYNDFDLRDQASSASVQARSMTQDFIDNYAIVGTAEACVARLSQINDLGIDKVITVGFADTTDNNIDGRYATKTFLNQIAPALKN
ncbi:MAG: LLM class flavin-dependent oxidoreductase [Actinobacteria bacterium]|nr:MAG: LLM class flavin-dependent oxidoreductase [Actinomycetota bacterium]